MVTSLFANSEFPSSKLKKNRDEDFTCVLVCLTCFLSKQVAQNLSRQNPASARHTTRGQTSLRLNPNLRTRRIAQHTSENNGAQTALRPCSIMCALSCIQAVAQSLCRQNRTTSVRRILSDGISPYTTICVHSSSEAGGRKFLGADLRPTNEQTIAEQLSPTVSVSTSPYHRRWRRISENRFARPM